MDNRIYELALAHRKPEFDTGLMFPGRWSPRAMSGELIDQFTLNSLFEAARWAPSAYNSQPWRFVYAQRESQEWNKLFDLLVEFNKEWAKNAGALILILSRKTFERNDKPSPTHSFDTGAAWMSLALEGARRGLVVHCMSGFDYEKARQTCSVPDHYAIEAMVAVGVLAEKSVLPETMQQNELPNERKRVQDFTSKGCFSSTWK